MGSEILDAISNANSKYMTGSQIDPESMLDKL